MPDLSVNRAGLKLRDAAEWAHGPVMAVEAWVGAFFTTLLSLMLGIPLLLAAAIAPFSGEVSRPWVVLFVVLAAVWLRFGATHLLRTWSGVRRGDRPLAPSVAVRQPPVTLVLRPIAVVWFLGHFALGVSAALFTEGAGAGDLEGARPVLRLLVVTVMAVAYTFAANGFLLAAVKALTGSDAWVWRVWSCRVLIDLGVVALSVLPLSLSRAAG